MIAMLYFRCILGTATMKKDNRPTILLIDDDKKIAKLLKTYFAKFDLNLVSEVLPSKGIKAFREKKPDLVILDVMLPEMDGFEICRILRAESNVPIVMLTARGDVNDRVIGLETGADDYLPKPFEPKELVARIEIILSRVADEKPTDDLLTFGQLTIKPSRREVTIAGEKVELTSKEYALLTLMCTNPDKVFSRDDIMNELSGIDSELFSRSVDILVSRLRTKLKPLDYIQTVWGLGYKFQIN